MGGSNVHHEPYEEMQDTPWITQGREIADIGGKGILDNYNKVNVFDEGTQKSLEARNNAIYKRAFDEADRNYANTIGKYNAQNYNQFGTLNATPAAYRTDQYNLDFQRQLDDLAYNKAMNYDTLMDNELKRRYNTLDMYNTLYQYGQTPYQQDIMNWNTRNTNKDLAYYDDLYNSQNSAGNKLYSTLGGITSAFASGIGSGLGSGFASNSGFGSGLKGLFGGGAK